MMTSSRVPATSISRRGLLVLAGTVGVAGLTAATAAFAESPKAGPQRSHRARRL